MKEILIGSVLILTIIGCGGKDKDADSQTDKPKPLLTRQEAERILDKTPEVIKWSDDVRRKYGGKVVPVCDVDRTPTDCEADGEKPAWIFKFYQSHKDRTILWQRFQVDAVSGDVTIWNPYKGRFVPLSEWRGKFRP